MELLMNVNRNYKDSVFTALFNDPDALRELYSAIEGVSIPQDMEIDINTLSDVLLKGQLNDVSFTIDNRLVVLIEHQSTISENLPLRLLEYIGKIYEKIIHYERRFQRRLEKIPKPEFIVLYNGKESFPEHKELRLSNAFMDVEGLKLTDSDKLPLELIVNVYNINQGYNQEMLMKSLTLYNYSVLTSKIWEYRNSKLPLEEAIELTIKYCVDNNILREFLKKHGSEVYSMLYGEYRIEDEIAVVMREAREDGFAEGREEGREEERKEGDKKLHAEKLNIAQNLLAEGSTSEFVQKITGLSLEEIAKL